MSPYPRDLLSGVFVVGRQPAILRQDSPSVAEFPDCVSPCVYHGLDGDHHPPAEFRTSPRSSEVRNIGVFVQVMTHTVPYVLLHGTETVFRYITVYRGTDVSDPGPFASGSLGSQFKGPFRNIDEFLRFGRDPAARDRSGAVAVESVYIRSHVDLDYITFLKNSVSGRYSVNDLLVYRDAGGTRKSAVTQERWTRTALFDMVSDPFVDLFCGHARFYVLGSQKDGLGGYAPRYPHEPYLLLILDNDHLGLPLLSAFQSAERQRCGVFKLLLAFDRLELAFSFVVGFERLSLFVINDQSALYHFRIVVSSDGE